jgi:hypothetical protein
MKRSIRYLVDAARAFERAPVEVVLAVLLAASFSYAVDAGGAAFRTWLEVAVAGVLIGAVAWTGTLLHALGTWNVRTRWAVTVGGAAIVAVYALLVMDFELTAEAWRAAMLVSAALLWIAYAPALAGAGRRSLAGDSSARDHAIGGASGIATDSLDAVAGRDRDSATDRVRRVDGRFLLRTIGALLYCAALYAGLALALGAVNMLFELGLRGDIYAHVFGWIFIVLAPWIVIGGLPDYVTAGAPLAGGAGRTDAGSGSVPGAAPATSVAGVVHRMSAFLVPPLLALYCAILYAYVVRIGVTGEVPKNLLSPMVLASGGLGALALFLFEPRPVPRAGVGDADVDGNGLARWLRAAPPLFLPLALLGVWAVGLRVGQYGWTEFRLLRILMLVVLALLAAGGTVQLVRRRRFHLHLVPLVLAAVLLAGAVGPWSVLAVSRRSQQAELATALRLADVEPDSPIAIDTATARTIPGDVYTRINDAARYLAGHFGPDALPPVLRERVAAGASVYDVASSIGLQRAWPAPGEESSFNGHFADGGAVDVRGMTAHRIMVSPQRGRASSGAVTVQQDSTVLHLLVDGRRLSGDLGRYTPSLRTPPDRGGMLAAADARIELVDEAGRAAGDLLILHIGLFMENDTLRLRHLDGLLFVGQPPGI